MIKGLLSRILFLLITLFPLNLLANSSSLANFHFSRLYNSALQESFYGFTFKDSIISVIVPENTNLSALKVSFTLEHADSAVVSNQRQFSNISIQNFEKELVYLLYKGGVVSKHYRIQVIK
ncbi:MAG: hypothetical protein MH472_12745, partial [Bacteroidia bacterium]|nr:hypothetical protein [Bacteroidia bacterium]